MKKLMMILALGSFGFGAQSFAFLQSGEQLICSSADNCYYTIDIIDLVGHEKTTVKITCPHFRGISYPSDRIYLRQNNESVLFSLLSENHQSVEMNILVSGATLNGTIVDPNGGQEKTLQCRFSIQH